MENLCHEINLRRILHISCEDIKAKKGMETFLIYIHCLTLVFIIKPLFK
jgi:hypothetical protein